MRRAGMKGVSEEKEVPVRCTERGGEQCTAPA